MSTSKSMLTPHARRVPADGISSASSEMRAMYVEGLATHSIMSQTHAIGNHNASAATATLEVVHLCGETLRVVAKWVILMDE